MCNIQQTTSGSNAITFPATSTLSFSCWVVELSSSGLSNDRPFPSRCGVEVSDLEVDRYEKELSVELVRKMLAKDEHHRSRGEESLGRSCLYMSLLIADLHSRIVYLKADS